MGKHLNYQQFKYFKNIKCSYSTQTKSNLKIQSSKTVDVIGPPDDLSNLRPIIFARPHNETILEEKYRLAREQTQSWNRKFWSEHNANFIKERKEFQQELVAQGNKSMTADEMSVFYKSFLDKNWRNHLAYNISWYKQNLGILFLELRVRLSKLKFK